ncbi:MAG: alginate lyase family protein [Vicinamibacterales bacterium]
MSVHAAVAEAVVEPGIRRPVFCAVDHLGRDRRVAEDVLRGVFTAAGETRLLGITPSWADVEPGGDKEWRVEWVKFTFGLDLAHAAAATGDRRYLDAWMRLVDSWMTEIAPGSDATEVAARRTLHWVYAWQRFADAPDLPRVPDDLAARIVDHVAAEAAYVRAHLTPERNHRTIELYMLLVVSLAFPGIDRDGRLAAFALEALHDNLLCDVRPDGAHREASTHYHCIALRSFLGAIENARRYRLAVPASFVARAERACEFAMHIHRPDGTIPACADADAADYRDVLALGARLFGRSDFAWAASAGATGTRPAVTSASFPDVGYYTQRSGWGGGSPTLSDERFLIFDCGPVGDGGHGHYDALAIDVSSARGPLLVDPGRFTYAEGEPNWRRWFKSTSAHNTVTVDGLDQTSYRRRRPKEPTAQAALLTRVSAPRLDLVAGEVRSPAYDAVHTRTVVFVADEYWLVTDHLTAPSPHDYDLRWHFAPSDRALVIEDDDTATRVIAPNVVVDLAPVRDVDVEEGWYSPLYGVKHPAPVASIRAHGTDVTYLSAIHPCASPAPAGRRLRVRSLASRASALSIVQIDATGPDGRSTDVVMWGLEVHDLAIAGFRGRARAAFARVDRSGETRELRVAGFESGAWDLRDNVHASKVAEATAWFGWSREVAR